MISAASPDSKRALRRWQTWLICIAVGLLLLGIGWWSRETVVARHGPAGWTAVQLAGFSTFISPSLEADPELKDRVIWRLEEQLTAAMDALPPSGQAVLRPIRIWVDPDPSLDATTMSTTLAMYYWQKQRSDRSALIKQRAGAIVISDVYGFIRSHGQYSVLLHELAHGYDDRQLKRQDPGMLKAFKAARTQGRYSAEEASPAVVDVREYFAVLTEAYFASRPETPHNRIALKTFDPQGYAAVEHAWGLR